ncbi:MAG: excinuclease ABC subunit UvrA, partial [Gemmataceae bacterium]
QVLRGKSSLTGQYLSGKKSIPVPGTRRIATRGARQPAAQARALDDPLLAPRAGNGAFLTVKGARQNNLQNIDVSFPLGAFVAVTGVSGSGKSSLVNEVLYLTLARRLHRARTAATAHDDILGLEHIDKVINVDQAPIGNTPSSNPATYTGVFDLIRQLFAQLPEAKVRGYRPQRFSFNKPGGRCEACDGNGQKKIEMHFLPDVWVECDVCLGQRYNQETLAVRYKEHSIADVLSMRVHEALALFGNLPKIRRVLQTLADVGLDYPSLGQAAPTLSGGEAQRVKLAAELARPSTGRTLYILDEPTTGLHFDDIHKLLEVLNRLVDLGNTVIVVEHNLDVIKTADWIIDLGPEAGPAGGRIVVQGTPEDVVKSAAHSHTAAALAPVLKAGPHVERPRYDPLAAEAPRSGDMELEVVGKDAAMPWQTDGRRWHTVERVTNEGKPCRWEGHILDWIDARVHELGEFSDTVWDQRSIVEIAAPPFPPRARGGKGGTQGWFLHAMTGQEWLLRLVFRVEKNRFKEADLVRRLGIRPLNETPGLEVYGDQERVWTTAHKGPWQSVTVLVHRLGEIDTPAFRAFLTEATASFHNNLKRLRTKPEDLMPWKINGERWHLGEKGFPPGKKVRWERSLLTRLLQLVREVEPGVEVRWDGRDAITLRVPGVSRAWAQWRTKKAIALECHFLGKKGQFNLSQIEDLGVAPNIGTQRKDGDLLYLHFQMIDQEQARRLKDLLVEQLRGFRDVFGNRGV